MPTHRLTCAVGVCYNYYYKTKSMLHEGYPITYHYFPRNSELCDRWIEACNRSGNLKPEVSFVCSIHFRSEDFIRQPNDSISQQPKRRLKYNVVPSINLTLDEIRSFSYRNKWKKTYGFSDDPEDNEVIIDSRGATIGAVRNNLNRKVGDSLGNEYMSLKMDYDQLLTDYEDMKNNSKIEIEKLKSLIKEKDDLFTMKLKKILSQYLTDTEIDLVLFLRKQKNQATES